MLMGQFTNNFLTLSTKRESCDLANDLTDFLARSDPYRYVHFFSVRMFTCPLYICLVCTLSDVTVSSLLGALVCLVYKKTCYPRGDRRPADD